MRGESQLMNVASVPSTLESRTPLSRPLISTANILRSSRSYSRSSLQLPQACIGTCHSGDLAIVLRAASDVRHALPLLNPAALACPHKGYVPSQPLQSSAYPECCLSHLVAQGLSRKRILQGHRPGLWPALSVSLDVKRLGCPCGTIQVTGDQFGQWSPHVSLLRPNRVQFLLLQRATTSIGSRQSGGHSFP
jgi:hypothetical protein